MQPLAGSCENIEAIDAEPSSEHEDEIVEIELDEARRKRRRGRVRIVAERRKSRERQIDLHGARARRHLVEHGRNQQREQQADSQNRNKPAIHTCSPLPRSGNPVYAAKSSNPQPRRIHFFGAPFSLSALVTAKLPARWPAHKESMLPVVPWRFPPPGHPACGAGLSR